VEVEKIRTMLFMEGRQHISVTPMGGKLILLHSPRKGELGAMVRGREDWLTYYFKEVKPWSANIFNDRREVWVKVMGVSLHVWGRVFSSWWELDSESLLILMLIRLVDHDWMWRRSKSLLLVEV
jgi:hypothetical protein